MTEMSLGSFIKRQLTLQQHQATPYYLLKQPYYTISVKPKPTQTIIGQRKDGGESGSTFGGWPRAAQLGSLKYHGGPSISGYS